MYQKIQVLSNKNITIYSSFDSSILKLIFNNELCRFINSIITDKKIFI